MGITRDILPHQFENIAPGEEDPQKRVDAERIMANYNAITGVIAVVEARGEYAEDGNSNGISTQTRCNLTLHTKDGEVGLLDTGDIVVISDGVNVWQKTTDEAPATQFNDEVSFSDENLISGEGVSDYSSPDFIEGLLFTIRKPGYPDLVLSDRILLGGERGLSGSEIPRSAQSEDTLESSLTGLESNLSREHEEDGTHSEGVFGSSHLAKDGFEGETFHNLIDGSFERDGDGDGIAEPWSAYNEPELGLSSEVVRQGQFSQRVDASQPGDGVETTLSEISHIRGEKLSVSVYAYTGSAQTRIEVYDGVSTTTSETFGSSGEWLRGHLFADIDESAEEVSIRVYADGQDIQYYDACVVTTGRLVKGFVENADKGIVEVSEVTSPENILFGFEDWTETLEEDVVLPDGWEVGGETPTLLKPYADGQRVGEVCGEIILFNNEGIIQQIPEVILRSLIGEEVCLSLYLRKDSNSIDPLRIALEGDSGVVTETTVEMSELGEGNWRRIYITGTPAPPTSQLFVKLENMAGTSDFTHCYMDGIMLHKGGNPAGYIAQNVYDTVLMNFGKSGSVEMGYLPGAGGISGDGYPLPFAGRLFRVSGYVEVAPSEDKEFDCLVRLNGSSTDLRVTFEPGENSVISSELVDFAVGDRVSIYSIPPLGGTDAEDLYITLEILKYRG